MSAQQKADKSRLDREKQDITEVMSTAEGRRLMHKILARSGIYRCSFNGQSNATIFNEGARNQGLILLAEIQSAAPGSYITMLKENSNE